MTKYSGAGIICVDNDRVLCVRGRATGKWGFPKGHREIGESTEDCALREFREETGRTLEYIRSDPVVFHGRNNIYYIININENKVPVSAKHDSREIDRIEWLEFDKLLSLKRKNVNSDLWTYINYHLAAQFYNDEIEYHSSEEHIYIYDEYDYLNQ